MQLFQGECNEVTHKGPTLPSLLVRRRTNKYSSTKLLGTMSMRSVERFILYQEGQ